MEPKKTISSTFFVPSLKINKDNLLKSGYINAYFKDDNKDIQYEDCVYLLFKPENLRDFRQFLEEEYERTSNIIEDYDYGGGFVVVVYRLNPRYKKDFDLIRRGQYSHTSKSFQSEFPKTIKIPNGLSYKEEISIQFRIFNKTADLKDFWEQKINVKFDDSQEVWYEFNEEKETLTYKKLEELV
jgi:hypothetical protein